MTTETETKPEPLVLAEIMAGMENYIDPNMSTRFDVTFQCSLKGYGREGQVAFIESQIKPYVEFVSKSGCQLLEINLRKKFSEDSREKYEDVDIFLDLVIPGRVRSELFSHAQFRESLSSFTKGFIAKRFIESFPLPFDKKEIPFAANFPDYILIIGRNSFFSPEEIKEILAIPDFSNMVHRALNEEVATDFPSFLGLVDNIGPGGYNGEKESKYKNIRIDFHWNGNVKPEIREHKISRIYRLLNNLENQYLVLKLSRLYGIPF